jgi:hypothetical protein
MRRWLIHGKASSDAIFCVEYGRLIFVVGCIAKPCKNLLAAQARAQLTSGVDRARAFSSDQSVFK